MYQRDYFTFNLICWKTCVAPEGSPNRGHELPMLVSVASVSWNYPANQRRKVPATQRQVLVLLGEWFELPLALHQLLPSWLPFLGQVHSQSVILYVLEAARSLFQKAQLDLLRIRRYCFRHRSHQYQNPGRLWVPQWSRKWHNRDIRV